MRVEGVNAIQARSTQQTISRESRQPAIKEQAQENPVALQNGAEKKFTEEELIHAIEKANQKLEFYEKRLEFSIHEKTKQIMIKIVNTETDEVIKEIPPEKILDMVAKFMEMAGLLVDEKA